MATTATRYGRRSSQHAVPGRRGRSARRSATRHAVGLGDLGPFLDRVVGVLVDDEQVVPADQAGDGARGWPASPTGRSGPPRCRASAASLSSASALARTLAKAREAPLCVPHLCDAADDGLLDARVLVEAEEAVGAEVDHVVAADRDLPVRPDLVHDQVLDGWSGTARRSARGSGSARSGAAPGQLLHREVCHASSSLQSVGDEISGFQQSIGRMPVPGAARDETKRSGAWQRQSHGARGREKGPGPLIVCTVRLRLSRFDPLAPVLRGEGLGVTGAARQEPHPSPPTPLPGVTGARGAEKSATICRTVFRGPDPFMGSSTVDTNPRIFCTNPPRSFVLRGPAAIPRLRQVGRAGR